MRILHIDEQRGWRGGEQQASWLIQGLAKRGHRVLIAGCAQGEFIDSRHGDVEISRIPLPFRGELDLWTAWKLSQIVRRERVDIVHAHSSHAHSMAVYARRWAGRGKVVVSRRVSFAPRDNALNRWKYKQPDKFICVSNKVRDVLREAGIVETKLEVVHSSVDLTRLDVEPLSRAELGVPEGVPLLVSAGALVGHKDHEALVTAMAQVRRKLPAARLVIAGEGELRGRIEARIAELGLGDCITLLGHRNDAPRLIRAADVYVSSSWSEGLGTSILEALACRTPVVATLAGGADEMVKPGETGYLVPSRNPDALAEAVVESLSNRGQARAMAENGRRLIEEQFVTERMIEGTLRVYESVLYS